MASSWSYAISGSLGGLTLKYINGYVNMDSTMESFYWLHWASIVYSVYSWAVWGRDPSMAEFTNNKSQCSQSNRFRRTEDVICGDGMDGMIVWYSFTNCLFPGCGANTIAARDLEHVLIVAAAWWLLTADGRGWKTSGGSLGDPGPRTGPPAVLQDGTIQNLSMRTCGHYTCK